MMGAVVRKRFLLVGLVAFVAGGISAAAVITNEFDNHLLICHPTGIDTRPSTSQTNEPYIMLYLNTAPTGTLEGNHNTHTTDIIPPYSYKLADGSMYSFIGMNWDAQGQYIWENGCTNP